MYRKILFSCFVLIFVFSCKKDNPTLIVDIEDDFYINMFEDINNGEQLFQLDITTINTQSCLNYQIDHDLVFDEQVNAIELTIKDLVEPEDCIQGTAFASLTVPFGSVLEGSYQFDIKLKDAVVNKGQLDVYVDRYELDMDSHHGIEIVNSILNRVPQNTIWGYVAYDDASSELAANNFIAELESLESIFSIQANTLYRTGYYGHFNLDDDKTLLLPGEINFNHFIPFIYQHGSDDLSEIIQVKNEACAGMDLEIQIFTGKGLNMYCN